jgi:hypothetical protein
MEKLKLDNFGVSELTSNELNEVFGGGFWSCFKEGFNEMWAECKKIAKEIKEFILK